MRSPNVAMSDIWWEENRPALSKLKKFIKGSGMAQRQILGFSPSGPGLILGVPKD